MSDQQSSIGSGAKFKGKITGAKALEINGDVEADIDIGKITIGQDAHFRGGIKADLAVISGIYEGTMQAESIWLTDTSRVSGEIRYQSLQMDRGAALNCSCLLYTSPSPRDGLLSRMPSSA